MIQYYHDNFETLDHIENVNNISSKTNYLGINIAKSH